MQDYEILTRLLDTVELSRLHQDTSSNDALIQYTVWEKTDMSLPNHAENKALGDTER